MRDFVGTVAEAGCRTFIVHARNAVLKGLSPKENREIPPLKYDYVHRLKRDFPQLEIVINGGITSARADRRHMAHVDGVMLGRAAYHDPWLLADAGKTRAEVVARDGASTRAPWTCRCAASRATCSAYTTACPTRALWRRLLSDPARLRRNGRRSCWKPRR